MHRCCSTSDAFPHRGYLHWQPRAPHWRRAEGRKDHRVRLADEPCLKSNSERAAYLEALLEEGDSRIITIGLRELAESAGGMAAIAERTGLSRETLYRTLSPRGNPRLDTLSALLRAMGLRLSVTAAGETAAD